MSDPTSDEAYRWPVLTESHAARWVADYDAAHERAFEVADLSALMPRFIVGIDPATNPADLKIDPMVIWQIPKPMTITTRNIDPELLELIYGQAVVPLCNREIPTKGTE